MFKVKFKNDTMFDLHDKRFRPILIDIIRQRKTGLVVNQFDKCIFMLESLEFFEDESGRMVNKDSIE